MLDDYEQVSTKHNPLDSYRVALDHALHFDGYGYFSPDTQRIKFAENHIYGKPATSFTIVGVVFAELW